MPPGTLLPSMDAAALRADAAEEDDTSAEWKEVEDAELEWKFCVGAIPIALLLAMLIHAVPFGAALQRIFFTMPVHEFGHAVTAWFCGFTAIPTLWKTLIPDTRGFIAPVLLLGGLGYAAYRARAAQKVGVISLCVALILLQAIGTLVIKADTARMLIAFGGDATGMVLATLLMGSFFFGKRTKLYKGSLRWGFVVIGAAAFVDIYATWWAARKDEGAVPYGTTGGMASDAMTLVDVHGWTIQALVNRYVVVGLCCLAALAAVYAWGVLKAKRVKETRGRHSTEA